MAEELKIYQPGEIVAADWVTKRDEIVAAAAEIVTVADNDDFEAATAAIAKLAKHRKELDAARKAITRRLDGVKKEIMAQERALAGSIEAEYNRLRAAAGDARNVHPRRSHGLRRPARGDRDAGQFAAGRCGSAGSPSRPVGFHADYSGRAIYAFHPGR